MGIFICGMLARVSSIVESMTNSGDRGVRSGLSGVGVTCGIIQVELEEAIRKGNEKFNKMITEQMQAREGIRESAEAEAKVCIT